MSGPNGPSGYALHALHGDWTCEGGWIRCSCGVALYRSFLPPRGETQRVAAAVALDRATEAAEDGYRPPEHYREAVELLHDDQDGERRTP